MIENIKYSFQMNMWGVPKFKEIHNMEEWYEKDFTADGYFQDAKLADLKNQMYDLQNTLETVQETLQEALKDE